MDAIKLFCLPYAGGSSAFYGKWRAALAPDIELVFVELSGRGMRFGEKLYQSFEQAVEDVYTTIRAQIKADEPYAIFGHSMGALLAFEAVQKMQQAQQNVPDWLFLSAKKPPIEKYHEKMDTHTLSRQAFCAHLKELGGTPQEFFDSEALQDLFLPIIRADYRILSQHRPNPNIQRLNSQLIILNGKEDIQEKDVLEWEELTNKTCDFHFFTGGHFYIQKHVATVHQLIRNKLGKQL